MSTLRLKVPSTRVFKKPPVEKGSSLRPIHLFLKKTYPKLFPKKPIPLAISVERGFRPLPEEISMRRVKRYLSRWCSRPQYLKAIAKGGDRYGVNGPEGKVTDEQIEYARERLKANSGKK